MRERAAEFLAEMKRRRSIRDFSDRPVSRQVIEDCLRVANSAPSGILDGFMALPVTVFYWTQHHDPAFQDLAASTILVLLVIMLSMNAVAIFIRNRAEKRRDW